MDTPSAILVAAYVAVIGVICLYGAHRYLLLFLYVRHRRGAGGEAPGRFTELPRVTVQLPMFNEAGVAARVIEAAARIDYPRDRLQIQVLDDSTDECADIARAVCERLAAAGHDIEYLHRTHRHGYKAGALADAMASATGEFIAVFDADFVPTADILNQTVHHFTDEAVGMVQARWEHINRDASLLTEIQAILLDGHFVVEQTARSASGRWFNFNGTAGLWRRRCIDEAGGWHHDTITEDTDLSYRAQLAGWTFRYLPDVVCPAEIPPTVGAVMSQQHRWNKGLLETAIKLLPRILDSRTPTRNKVEAWFHLTSPVIHVAILLLALLAAPAFLVPFPETLGRLIPGAALASLALGTIAAGSFFVVSQMARGRSLGRALFHVPALMAVGIGVSFVNTRGFFEALLGIRSPFVRTPKSSGGQRTDADPALTRQRRRSLIPAGLIETLLGLLMLGCIGGALVRPFTLVGIPFLILFAAGFLGMGLPLLMERIAPIARADGAVEAAEA